MSKSIRDLMSRRVAEPAPDGAPSTESTTSPPLPDGKPEAQAPVRRTGAARSFGAAWKEQEQARMLADAERDGQTVELDPDLCDPSPFADRLPDATDASYPAFVEAIRAEGQHTAALVRPHPGQPGRYQIAFGRRRTRAARDLGRKLRAVIRDLSDADLVVAQGSENLSRADLSYIERAHFAWNMVRSGIAREVVRRAMSADEARVSNYLSVAEHVPARVLDAIGPAPKVGRPKWVTLADRLKTASPEQIDTALASPDLAGKASDERFAVVLAALSAAPKPAKKLKAETVKDSKGLKFARVERSTSGVRVTTDEKIEPGFGDYLAGRLPEILAAYRASKG